MNDQRLCPYYGKSEPYCEVGCGYISPHEVGLIIRHCAARFEECGRYAEISDRLPVAAVFRALRAEEAPRDRREERFRAVPPIG